MDYQNYDSNIKQEVNKNNGNGKIIVLIVIALLVCAGIILGPTLYSTFKAMGLLNGVRQDAAEDTAYSIISSVEYAHALTSLNSKDGSITLEQIRQEYDSKFSTWNEDNTIIPNDDDFVCNVTVNTDNEMLVSCDVNGEKIESELLSLSLNNSSNTQNNNTEQNNQTNNNQNTNTSLTEAEALQIGKDLYKYAHSVGNCKEFEYLHNQPVGSIVLNYDEVASKFTNEYINNKSTTAYKNVFSTIEKDAEGKYIDASVCGFGLSCATSSLTDFKMVNKTNDYITFEATVTVTSICGENSGSIVRTETDTFSIKKENNTWKIDYYEFQIITDLLK